MAARDTRGRGTGPPTAFGRHRGIGGNLLAGFVILGTVFWYGHPGESGGGSPPGPAARSGRLPPDPRQPRTEDLDGDGAGETIEVRSEKVPGGERAFLVCRHGDGSEWWRVPLGRDLHYSDIPMRPARGFEILRWEVLELPAGGKVVLVLAQHRRYSPSQVLVLGPAGEVLAEYLHDGHIYAVAVAPIQLHGKVIGVLEAINPALFPSGELSAPATGTVIVSSRLSA